MTDAPAAEAPITHGFISFYERKQVETHAPDLLKARALAKVEFQKMFPRRKIKDWDITTMIAERDTAGGTRTGEQVVHLPLF